MVESYSIAELLDTFVAERATRMLIKSGAQPTIELPSDTGTTLGVLDIAPPTADKVLDLLRVIASPEQIRELELCGRLRFRYVHADSGLGASIQVSVRVSAHIDHDIFKLELQNL